MKFKVGDIVRPTRDYLINAVENNTIYHLEYINGFQVLEIKDDRIFYYINEKDAFYKAEDLELVPEELEFEYGEEVEVSNNGTEWEERIFLAKIPGNPYDPYVCVDMCEEEDFALGKRFEWSSWEYIRKLRPQLTRKEIAEKFGVNEDFILVD